MAEEDIIYGKNRHFFGGIEPSNMLKFTAIEKDGAVIIDAQLPEDTVIEGQTLCTVAGAVIRRKTNEYPKDEFDGDKVVDITASAVLVDNINPSGNSYYYAAFPYTTQGVYNRNVSNRACINVPGCMVKFSAKNVYDYTKNSSSIKLECVLPEGVVGAMIRKSTNEYPKNETDGEEVVNMGTSGTFVDLGVEIGNVYYYSAFPYFSNGAYNRDESNRINVSCAKYNYLFGFDLDIDDPDPDTRVTYPDDVDNAKYKPAYMNYDIGVFNYGDWPSNPGEKFMPKPCMLKYDGTVGHYLDPNDYSKREDGKTISKVADTTFEGNAMMEWPKIYTYREEVDGVYKFRCSDMPQGEGWDCWCNYDIYDNQIDHFYTSIYTTSYTESLATGTRLRSISGTTIHTADYYTEFREWGKYRVNNSTKHDSWDIGLIADHLLIQDLLVMMAKTTDCQTAFGNGVHGAYSYRNSSSGTLNDKGLFWGNNDQKSGVKVFGMEHYWGNDRRFLAGWNLYAGKQYVKITKGAHDGVKSSDSDTVSTKFNLFDPSNRSKQISVTTTSFSTTSIYCASMVTKPYGRFPTGDITTGSASTYEADYIKWSNSSENTVNTIGGTCESSAGNNGPFAVYSQSASSGQVYTTTTLSCKPPLQQG